MAGERWYYVTGTDTGFGAETVDILITKGHNVFAGRYLPTSPARAPGPGRVVEVQVDVTNDESVKAAAGVIETTLGATGELAGVVNNAGLLLECGPCEWTPIANYVKMYDVNVLGMVRVTTSVMPLLRKAQGRIVNCASIAGRTGFPNLGAYCASKHAVEGYSESLRREVFQFGVSVHIVEPGVFAATGLYSSFHSGIEKQWSQLPPETRADYGEDYKNYMAKFVSDGLIKLSNKDCSLVPKAYYHALTSPSPKMRYREGKDSKYEITLLTWLHETWQDWALRSHVPMLVWPSTSTAKARANVIARCGGWPLVRRLMLFAVLGLLWKLFTKRFGAPAIGPTGGLVLQK